MSEIISGNGRDEGERTGDEIVHLPTPIEVEPSPDALLAIVEQRPDGRDECTLFPADADEDELLTHWMTAARGSFVSLAEMR